MLEEPLFQLVSPHFSQELRDEISALTDHARLRPDDVAHLEEERALVIPLARLPIVIPEGRLGLFTRRTYDESVRVPALLRIGHVIDVDVREEMVEGFSEVQLERGLTAKDRTLSLSSVQEKRGVLFYRLEAHVELFDIELVDLAGDGAKSADPPGGI